MFSSLLILALAAVSSSVQANIFTTAPVATTSWPAGQKTTVAWKDDGNSPSLASFGPSLIGLYAGNVQQQTLLQVISTGVDVSQVNSVDFTPDATVGPNFNSYFIRFTSNSLKDASQPQFNAEAFSAKFTLTGMTGTFNATVQAQINGSSVPATGASSTPAASSASASTASVSKTSSNQASSVKSSSTASSSATKAPSNGVGRIVAPSIFGATGIAAIAIAFFL
ncbi:hypothetical protein B0F90DRAFT_1727968 [Multifurca ochricompacta]|uniref:Yeast cell wall synthesis Kre9/Knh1-like N-terminal domain-containing protein n=1 Tax=Multifurca ochricompacta TaxID=376703 RepID=A0AAD4QLI4_9AGAM|nr:hypothetical protein B0F90DRAFT_1727968 [Multifurca ochricompacta]